MPREPMTKQSLVYILFFAAGLAMGVGIGLTKPSAVAPIEIVVQRQENLSAAPLEALSSADDGLFKRLLPHIRSTAQAEIKAEFDKVADDIDKVDPHKLAAGKTGAFGSFLAAAIAALVKRLVQALIVALLLSVMLALFWAYWYYPVGFVAIWVASTTLLTKFVARSEARKVCLDSSPKSSSTPSRPSAT